MYSTRYSIILQRYETKSADPILGQPCPKFLPHCVICWNCIQMAVPRCVSPVLFCLSSNMFFAWWPKTDHFLGTGATGRESSIPVATSITHLQLLLLQSAVTTILAGQSQRRVAVCFGHANGIRTILTLMKTRIK